MKKARTLRLSQRLYKRYVLGILTLVFTLNSVDRALINLFLEPIKHDLHLSDTQLGFLTGIAFGVFYAILGLPIARWADHGNRVTITSLAMGLWSLTVMACLFVTNFIQLAAARVAAAVGEAGCMPPTYSLVGDYFPKPAERTWAMSIYFLSNPGSALLAFVLGGWLSELYGWRGAFVIMGIPGLLLALLVRLTIREPRTLSAPLERASQHASQPTMRSVLSLLWQRDSSRHLCLGLIIFHMFGFGLGGWCAAFLMRNHGMGTAEVGLWFGLIFAASGVAGLLLGGYIAARMGGGRERHQLWINAAVTALLLPCYALFLLLPTKPLALAALVPLVVATNVVLGPSFALLQRIVPAGMRATTLSFVMLLSNFLGAGLAPQLVGIMSDLLRPAFGNDSLRIAMILMSLCALWAGWHFWRSARTVIADLTPLDSKAANESSLLIGSAGAG